MTYVPTSDDPTAYEIWRMHQEHYDKTLLSAFQSQVKQLTELGAIDNRFEKLKNAQDALNALEKTLSEMRETISGLSLSSLSPLPHEDQEECERFKANLFANLFKRDNSKDGVDDYEKPFLDDDFDDPFLDPESANEDEQPREGIVISLETRKPL